MTLPAAAASSSGAPGSHARRVVFVDIARALAVVLMLYSHTIDAVLASAYRTGTWYDVWKFQRGLTASLFLLLSGFAFSVATSKRWTSHMGLSPAVLKRARRFGFFVLLGYGLHFPVARVIDLPAANEAQWRAFLGVDVLQLIGVTLIGVQLLLLATRSRWVFTAAALVLAAAVVAGTSLAWSTNWTAVLPHWLAAYLSPSLGSQFPLFPWSAFVLLGVGLGQVYAQWGGAHLRLYANSVLLLMGAAMVGLVLLLRTLSIPIYGSGPTNFVLSEFLIRAGVCLIVLAGIAHATGRMTRLPRIFSPVAQETLLIYFVHLCIVYGSVWNNGLSQLYGRTLGPQGTVFYVVLVIVSMAGLAWYWNWCKHARPRLARWISVAAGVLLVYALL